MDSPAPDLSEQLDGIAVEHRFAQLPDVRIHYVAAGSGPLVVLLHGFPEFWYTWRHLLPALARAGYRVVAPDLRGFNLSSKPDAVGAYAVKHVIGDIVGLVRALGAERVRLIGHDFGAGVAWGCAMHDPELFERIAVLNGPHPERLLHAFRSPVQLLKSWYVFAMQLPVIPEVFLRRRGYAFLLNALRDDQQRPGSYSELDLKRYAQAYAQPGALHAMVNLYRALLRPNTRIPVRRIDLPALVLWGARDAHLGRELAKPDPALVPNCRVRYFEDGGHFVHHDLAEPVTRALLEFLQH